VTAAQVITVTLPDGQQVNLWLFADGTVEANWRPEAGDGWRPVEMVGGSVVVDRQAA
jgi:hypothetical protein